MIGSARELREGLPLSDIVIEQILSIMNAERSILLDDFELG
jgi:hypothetical protein